MSDQRFKKRWANQLSTARKKTLLWERGSLPSVPYDISEDSVVEYIRALQPYLERANRFPFLQLNKVLCITLRYVLGGCIVLMRLPKLFQQGYVYLFFTLKNVWIYMLILLLNLYFYGVLAGLFATLFLIIFIVFIPLIFDAPLAGLFDLFDRCTRYLWNKRDFI